jgi:hypothetical protein
MSSIINACGQLSLLGWKIAVADTNMIQSCNGFRFLFESFAVRLQEAFP